MKLIAQNATNNVATLRILDDAGLPKTGVAFNAAGLAVWYVPEGGTAVQITLTSGNWTETKFGEYEVDVPDAPYETVQTIRIVGSLTDSVVIPDRHQVFSSLWTSLPSAADTAEAVAQYDQRDEEATPGTIGWYFKKLRQANLTIEAVVTNDITATTTTFSVDLTSYPTGAFRHAVALVVENSANLDQNSPIDSFTNNTTYSTIVVEEPFTAIPQPGDVIVIAAASHVHSIAAIAAGVWGAATSGYSAVTGSFGYVLNAITTMIEFVGGVWRWKGTALSQSPQPTGEVVHVPTPNVSGNLVLTQGDTYDGIGNPKAQWEVEQDYTDGWSVVLTIRDKDDVVIYTTVGEVVSDELIAVTIETPEGLEMEGCPGQWQGKFDVELTKASSVQTIAVGVCYINEDQTR